MSSNSHTDAAVEIVRALAADGAPVGQSDCCACCGCEVWDNEALADLKDPYEAYQRTEIHRPDCPWRLAREAVAEWDDVAGGR